MNRNTSAGSVRILIYVFPALMDMIMAVVLFVNAVRLAKMGASATVVAGSATVWSLLYMLACPIVGRYVTASNAARLMLASCAAMVLLCALFIVVPGVVGIYLLCAGVGAAASLFFAPFQIFMKAVDTAGEKSMTYSTGLYTFAWSTGFAVGPFVSGFLMETGTAASPGMETGGWKYAYVFAGAGALVAAVGIRLLQHLAHPHAPAAGPADPVAAPPARPLFDYSRMPDLAWLGWVGAGVGVLVLSIIRAVFPAHAVKDLQLADSTQGTILFLLSAAQALTGLALCLSRLWMYRATAVGAFAVVGIAGSLCFGFGATPPALYLGAILFGVYSGAFFFYLVFHALTHPVHSGRYVAINESVVGVGGIAGPMLGGMLADLFGFNFSCSAGAALILAVTIFQAGVHRRRPPAPATGTLSP